MVDDSAALIIVGEPFSSTAYSLGASLLVGGAASSLVGLILESVPQIILGISQVRVLGAPRFPGDDDARRQMSEADRGGHFVLALPSSTVTPVSVDANFAGSSGHRHRGGNVIEDHEGGCARVACATRCPLHLVGARQPAHSV